MKIVGRISVILITVIIALCALFCAGCGKNFSKMENVQCDGNYRIFTYNYISEDGSYVYASRSIEQVIKKYVHKSRLDSWTHRYVPEKDGAYFGYTFYYGNDKDYYDLAIGYIYFERNFRISVFTVVNDVDRDASICAYGDNSLIFLANGEYKIFDRATKSLSSLEIPAELDGYSVINKSILNDNFVTITFRDDTANENIIYLCDGNGLEKTFRVDSGVYPKSIEDGYLLLDNTTDIILGINLADGERLNADEASQLYDKKENKFHIDGKEYEYRIERSGKEDLLVITDGDGEEHPFTVDDIRQTVPQVKEAFTLYSPHEPHISGTYCANGEFYILIRNELELLGYYQITPPLVLRYDSDKDGFSYIGFHPDIHSYKIYNIQKF